MSIDSRNDENISIEKQQIIVLIDVSLRFHVHVRHNNHLKMHWIPRKNLEGCNFDQLGFYSSIRICRWSDVELPFHIQGA